MTNVIWQGTVDNLDLSGIANGDNQPMRIVEDADGVLMTEFASSKLTDDETAAVEYSDDWYADYQCRFRDMSPAPAPGLEARLVKANLLG